METNSPHDIFISYSRKNKGLVLPIKEEIERTLGLGCWIDLSDVPCGSENFIENVIPGIRESRIAFLFFLTAESQTSEYAMNEIGFARNRAKKRVILVRINDDSMTDEFFFKYQGADIIDWRQPEQKAKLLDNLRAWANQVNEPHSSTSPQKPSDESVKTQPDVSFVVCPICGRKNSVRGYVIQGRGDYFSNRIFLPAAGRGHGATLYAAGSYGIYWSSIPNSDNIHAWDLRFNSDDHCTGNHYYRYNGLSVRPVQGFTKKRTK